MKCYVEIRLPDCIVRHRIAQGDNGSVHASDLAAAVAQAVKNCENDIVPCNLDMIDLMAEYYEEME